MSNQYKITEEQKKQLLQISAQTLPDNPSREGYSAEQIRGRLYKPYAALIDMINGVFGTAYTDVSDMQTALQNGDIFSRGFVGWNPTYTYGAGEVTFYPDIGKYGAFVKSVQAGNTNHTPYTDGAVNSAWWSEVVNFNTVTDDFFAEIKAAQAAAEAAQSAAETAQGKAEDAQAAAEEAESGAQTQAQAAASSATAAEESAEQAQTNAGEASASATAAAESAAAASGSESAAAEAAGSASKSAEEAATSAGEAASSASSAQAAQAAAETAKESVEASADAAAKSAESARASATAAGNSATAAAGSAGDAESAKAAAQTAQNAAESAEGNAQAYAGQASGSASAASQSEINARAYMEQAKQYAQKEYQVVESFDDLPRPGDSAYIYLVPSGSGSSNDHYSEYLWISEANDYEFVGAINEVDLSGYAQTNGTYPNMTVGNASNAASAQTAVKATQDAAGNDIAATYAKQTGTYPNMSVGTASEAGYADAAASADTAGYATTAKGDASGNDIEATYAKQTGTYAGMTVGNATQAGSANDPSAVHFTAQTLTDEQKAQARTNIGAADAGTVATNTSDIADLESDVQKIIDGTTSVAEAAHADTADSATKAAQDAAGNVIADTYAKQQGSYPQMSVGNASNAKLASNSNMLGGVAAASYALKQNSNGGFEGGDGASSTGNGAAVGADASSASGFAGGYNSSASGGGSAGNSAMTTNGGAVGNGTSSTSGFAGGQASSTTTGVAIGTNAVASGAGAVQLGTGNNTAANTLQFRSYPLVDANGNISPARLLDMYPVGSYYITESSTTPASLFGGSWVQVINKFLYGASAQSYVGQEGGEAAHILTVNEMPSHAHTPHGYTWITSRGGNTGNLQVTHISGRNALGIEFMQDYDQNRHTGDTGGGVAHNNLPPYRYVNIWRRTA